MAKYKLGVVESNGLRRVIALKNEGAMSRGNITYLRKVMLGSCIIYYKEVQVWDRKY